MTDLMDITGPILKGSVITVELFIITIILSLLLGVLVALGKTSKIKPLRIILSLYTWAFRGTPLLLQLFFIYFGLPVIGINLDPMVAAALAFTVNYGAYFAEIFRAGIESVDKGQFEAAKVLGMSYSKTMIKIIIPQAIKIVIPPICNENTNLIKDTSLVAAIGLGDLLRGAKEGVMSDFTIFPFVIAAVMYLFLTSFLVFAFSKLEQRFNVY